MAEEKKQVWIACRATAKCEGKMALVVFLQRNPGGGSSTRYRCLTCNRTFHVTV